jgi:copper chaperone CopZ
MTCAHVVDVALKKVPGADSVDVSLNKGLATVKLKPGNSATVAGLWKLIHAKGYTPKASTVLARWEIISAAGGVQLKVSGTSETLTLARDAKNPSAYEEARRRIGQSVTVQGILTPVKDLKASVPLVVTDVKSGEQRGN